MPARSTTLVTWLSGALALGALIYLNPDLAKTIGAFILVLSVLVFVHEWGHYQFALWGGMKVNRFGIGFPPWIYTKRHNSIDYSIGALPIGGMVDIAGLGSEEEMVATAKDSTGGIGTAGTTVEGVEAQSAARPSRMEAYRHRRPERPHGEKEFQDATLGWRFWTLFAGPLMNFLFAMLVFVALFSFVGVPDLDASKPTHRLEAVKEDYPAAAAGIVAGDRLIGLNGVRIADVQELRKRIGGSEGKPLTLMIERKGRVFEKTVRPVWDEVPNADGKGTTRMPFIGIQFGVDIVYKKIGFAAAIARGWNTTIGISATILELLGRAFTFRLSAEERRDIGGPVKIAQVAGETARNGWQDLVVFTAALSVNLGLMNLLPLPALDGGRILFLGFELLAGRPLDARKEGLVHMAGMVMLLAFMLFITVRDVLPLIQQGLEKVF